MKIRLGDIPRRYGLPGGSGRKRNGEGRGRSLFPLWLLIWAAVCVLGAPLLIIMALHLPPVQNRVIREVVRQIEKAAPVSVQLGSYRWWPFSRLHLFDLKVQAAGKDVLVCGKAQLAYHLSLRRPYFHPDEIYLEKPAFHLEKDSAGHWRLPGGEAGENAVGASQSSSWLRFPWPRVKIVSGAIEALQDGRPVLTIRDVTGALTVRAVTGPEGPAVTIDFGQWQGRAEAPAWGTFQLSGVAELHPNAFLSHSVYLTTSKGDGVSCKGRVGLEPSYDVDLDIESKTFSLEPFPELKQVFSPLNVVSGRINIKHRSGLWLVEHSLRSNLGNLEGNLKMEDGPPGNNGARWVTRFSDLKIPLPREFPELRLGGQLDLTLRGSDLASSQIQWKGRIDPSKWGEESVRGGEIAGSYDQGILNIKTAAVQASSGDFSLSGAADLEGFWNSAHRGDVKLELRAEKANLEKLLTGAPRGIGAILRVDGRYAPGGIRNWKTWQAGMEADVNIPEFLALKAGGTCKDQAVDINYSLQAADLRKVTSLAPAWEGKGQATSRGSFKGQWPDLVWEGEVLFPHLEYGPVQADEASLSGKGKITGKEARRELTLKAQSLTIYSNKVGSVRADLDQQGDVCSFELKAEQPWNRASESLSGRLEKLWIGPQALIVQHGRLAWRDQVASVEGRIEWLKDGIRIHAFNAEQGAQKIQAAGELSRGARNDLRITLKDVATGQWLGAFGIKDVVTGVTDGQIHLGGRAEQPELSLNLQLTGGTLYLEEAFAQQLSLVKDDPREEKQQTAGKTQPRKTEARPEKKGKKSVSGSKKTKASGRRVAAGSEVRAPVVEGRPPVVSTQAAVAVNEPLQAGAGEPMAEPVDRDRKSISEAPRTVAAKDRPPKGASVEPVPDIQIPLDRLHLQGTYSGSTLHLEGELQSTMAQSPVPLSARLPLHFSLNPFTFDVRPSDSLESALRVADLRVEALLPYLDVLNKVGGRIEGEIHTGGTVAQPVVKGSGVWRDGGFVVKIWPHPVENIQLDWQADAKEITIRKSRMKVLGGDVVLTGKVDYPQFETMEYEALGQDLDVAGIYGIKGKVSGRAHYAENEKGAQLTGALRFSKAEMNLGELETVLAKNIEVIDADVQGDLVEIRGDEKRQESYYNRLKMEVGLELPPSGTWVRGKGLEAEIIGGLRIEKAPYGPLNLVGGLQTVKGSYTFQGSKLNIVDGELLFWGSRRPDPVLKIVCQKDIRDVTIQVQVTGPLSRPKLAMSSVPALDQVDILSYLLFGQPAGELNTREAFQLQDKAASWIGSATSHALKGVLGNTPFTPDSLQFRSANTNRTDHSLTTRTTTEKASDNKGEGGVVEIGKYITPDLYVTYQKGVMGEKDNQVQLEYRLNRHISVQTQFGGPADQSGVDVFWRYDFGK